ncbi:hypothetical protein [Marinococcus halophilus]|uniref:hypothetical protein n=1 Tax=Marinococcus halophilus TaxID=1371 RepID=UPI0009A69E23|nr:hypothetical protein [Marinococcus halophilus]
MPKTLNYVAYIALAAPALNADPKLKRFFDGTYCITSSLPDDKMAMPVEGMDAAFIPEVLTAASKIRISGELRENGIILGTPESLFLYADELWVAMHKDIEALFRACILLPCKGFLFVFFLTSNH